MKTRKGFLPADSIYPFRGLNTLDPSPQAPPSTSPAMVNVDVIKGAEQKRRGYSFMGDAFDDPVIGLEEFETLAGSKQQLAFTTKKQFLWGGTSWGDVSNTTNTWTGTLTNYFEATPIAGLDGSGNYKKWLLITNGKDVPKYWDGSAIVDYAPTGISAFKTYRSAQFFYGHLVLANITYTTPAQETNAIYWTDTQKLLDFSGTNGGVVKLSDTEGEIWKLLPFGDRLMLYSENSIHSMMYVAGDALYTFEKVLGSTRLVSARCAVSINGGLHLYLNQDNVVAFDGSKLIRFVGEQITRTYREELFVNNRNLAFGFHDAGKEHVYFGVPTGASTQKVYKLEYKLEDFSNSTYVVHDYQDDPTCMGLFSRDITLRYNSSSLSGVTYDMCNFTYNQGTVKGGFPLRVMGTEAGKVCLCDDLIMADGEEAIEAFVDSIDFTVPQEYQSSQARWLEIELDLRGFEVSVLYSTNQGQSYTLVQDLPLTSTYTKYKLPIDVMSPTLRIRLVNNCINSTFYRRWLRLWLCPGGPA